MPLTTIDPSLYTASWNQPATTPAKKKTVATPGVTSTGFSINPSPTEYNPAYGGKPGVVGLPPSLYQGVQSLYPGITGLTSDVGNIINAQTRGELSPYTTNAILDQAAAFGMKSGMPLSNFAGSAGLKQLGLNVEKQQQMGTDNYAKFLASLAGTATDPNLAASLATWNATNAAAGNPEAVALAAQEAYEKALANARAGVKSVSPGGGTVAPSFGGGGASRSLGPGAYGTPSPVYGATGPFGNYNPAMAGQNWSNWAASLPATAFTPQNNLFLDEFGRTTENTPSFQPGDFTGINVADYQPAGGGSPDWGAIYEEAGLPYTDWGNSGINWDMYS